ncbi:MAG: MarR family transcriptional regulator [Desulfobacteraceae bacterium]|jgi:MarR family 2-MHQ and catechol resistance regulon transcriptional repressor
MKAERYVSDLSTNEKVLMAMVRAAEIFKRTHSAIFRNYGLSFPQYNILRVLDASRNGINRISEVSRIMLVPGANMTGLTKRLEKNGFIIRKSDPRDERVTLLEITPKGRKTLKNIEQEKDKATEIMLKGFSEEDITDFLKKLKRLIKNKMLSS